MHKRRKFSKVERDSVAERAKNSCEYCKSNQSYTPDIFTLEHSIPLSLNGSNDISLNIALACGGCNTFKRSYVRGINPDTGIVEDLFNPRTDIWSDHFRWSENYLFVLGITPIGKATVNLLHLNRETVVNLRAVLFLIGKHPIE